MSYQSNLGTGDAFSSVLSTLQNQRRRLDVISTNISNINTIGFKSSRMTFLEMLGKTVGKLYTPFEQGSFTSTGSTTDIAIQGKSFFVIRNGEDMNYTRAGSFYFDSEGKLVNQDRLPVQGWTLNETIEDINDVSESEDVGAMGAVGDILLDPDMAVGALATQNVFLGGNLDAGLQTVANVMKSSDIFSEGTETNPATLATMLNDLTQVDILNGDELMDNDEIVITGTDHNGGAVDATFVYGSANNGETLGDLISFIDNAFGETVSVTLEDGEIILTDTVSGDSQTSIAMSMGELAAGSITLPQFTNPTVGETPRANTSIIVYDSFGTAHHLNIEFVKTSDDREWSWEVTAEGNESPESGYSGIITFDTDGKFVSMTFDDGTGELVVDPGNGASTLTLSLHAGGEAGISGITQFDASTSLGARHQDGQASGSLEGISVNENGYIFGTFSNGVIMQLAQLAVAEFDDPTNLDKSGSSNFLPNNLSGDAVIGRASEFDTILMSGHLEQSNVDLADQFIQMIDAQKGYQAASRIVSTLDNILEETTRFGR